MKKEKIFEVQGKFKQKNENKKFTKKVSAISEKMALEKTMALLGSHHKLKRRNIFIEEIKEAK